MTRDQNSSDNIGLLILLIVLTVTMFGFFIYKEDLIQPAKFCTTDPTHKAALVQQCLKELPVSKESADSCYIKAAKYADQHCCTLTEGYSHCSMYSDKLSTRANPDLVF